jgi:hypothetical protein
MDRLKDGVVSLLACSASVTQSSSNHAIDGAEHEQSFDFQRLISDPTQVFSNPMLHPGDS